MYLLPTPPKESIGGTKPKHHSLALDFHLSQFVYISDLKAFAESRDFANLSEVEQERINIEYEQQCFAYETLRQRVEDY